MRNPLLLFNTRILNQGNHGISAAKGEKTDFGKGQKKIQYRLHTLIPRAVVLSAMFMTTFTVMVMSVVITMRIRIIGKCSGRERFRCVVRQALHTCIQFDPGIRESHLSAHSNTTADQRIDLSRLKKTSQGAMSASVRVDNLLSGDLSVLYIVQFKLLRMSKMLENLSVFVSDCDPHGIPSFLHYDLINFYRFVFTAASRDQQPFPADKRIRHLFSRAVVYRRNGGAGDVHSGGTGFLREPFAVQKAQRLKLVQRYLHALVGRYIVRRKAAVNRQLFYPAAFDRPWHKLSFLTCVNYNHTPVDDICQYVLAVLSKNSAERKKAA
jgi:hypothetical protein